MSPPKEDYAEASTMGTSNSTPFFSDQEDERTQSIVTRVKKKRKRNNYGGDTRRQVGGSSISTEYTSLLRSSSSSLRNNNEGDYDSVSPSNASKANYYSLIQQTSTTHYWKISTCCSVIICVLIVMAFLSFIIYSSCFIRPIVLLDQIQVYRLPLDISQPIVGFGVLLNTYNLNWRPLYLDNCTFYATVSDTANQVSYEISQPILLVHNRSSVMLHHMRSTQFRQQLLLNLTVEANVDKLASAIVDSVLYRATKYIALKFDGVCESRNTMGWKWNIPVSRLQQYNLKVKGR